MKEELEKRLILLTNFWYDYVSCDHHKDRDCHFYIHKKWSYGKEPIYAVEHYGYMAELEWTEYPTYGEALSALIEWLESEIKEVYEHMPTLKTADDYNWQGVEKVCKKYALFPIP